MVLKELYIIIVTCYKYDIVFFWFYNAMGQRHDFRIYEKALSHALAHLRENMLESRIPNYFQIFNPLYIWMGIWVLVAFDYFHVSLHNAGMDEIYFLELKATFELVVEDTIVEEINKFWQHLFKLGTKLLPPWALFAELDGQAPIEHVLEINDNGSGHNCFIKFSANKYIEKINCDKILFVYYSTFRQCFNIGLQAPIWRDRGPNWVKEYINFLEEEYRSCLRTFKISNVVLGHIYAYYSLQETWKIIDYS
ncbi:hypothetical protein ACJX0J_036865, partial [Zea mays]